MGLSPWRGAAEALSERSGLASGSCACRWADPITGKRVSKSRTFAGTKRQAIAQLERLAGEARDSPQRRGIALPEKLTLNQLVETHLDRWQGSPTTLDRYRRIVKALHRADHRAPTGP